MTYSWRRAVATNHNSFIPDCGQTFFKVLMGQNAQVLLRNIPSNGELYVWEVVVLGNSRKYPYQTTDGFHVLSPPSFRKFQNVLPPPFLQNSIIVNPPSPSEFLFFWKYIFDLAMPIWTNEHKFMPPQGCDLATPGDKLYSNLPLVARLCKLLFRSEFGYKNKHH